MQNPRPTHFQFRLHSSAVFLLLCILPLVSPGLVAGEKATTAEEDLLPIQIQLIWGTNNEKEPDDPKLKELDENLLARLRAFKWDHYYEVARRKAILKPQTPQKIKVSDKCSIYAEYKGDQMIRVKFYGEKKLVWKGDYRLKSELPLAIAGDDQNDNVWFVLVSLVNEGDTNSGEEAEKEDQKDPGAEK